MPRVGLFCIVFFFFSSRRRHTRCGRDWSSDVCSSDLREFGVLEYFLRATRLALAERNPDRRGEKQLAVVEGDGRAQPFAQRLGEADDALDFALRQNDERELVARQPGERVLRLE